MKKILSIAICCVMALCVHAQSTQIEINGTNGRTDRINIEDILTLTYDNVSKEDESGITLNWVSSSLIGQFRSNAVALSPNENYVYAEGVDHCLRCFDAKTGVEKWKFELRDAKYGSAASGYTTSTPSIDKDGTIYIADGSDGNGKLFAVNPDGTLKWFTFNDPATGFWNKGQNANAKIRQTSVTIGDKYVYIGNGGSSGTVVAFDKTNGHRAGYVVASDNHNNGPSGAVLSEPVITKQGYLYIYNENWGVNIVKMSDFKYDNTFTPCSWMGWQEYGNYMSCCGGSNAADADGNWYFTIYSDKNHKTNKIVSIDSEGKERWSTEITDAGANDQGGIVIGPDNVIYASLNASNGSNGGIVAIDGNTGKILWHYGEAKVSCAPAVAANGNVVFFTETGYMIVLSPDGKKLASQDVADLADSNGMSGEAGWTLGTAKVWSAPVIASDGTIYVGVTNNPQRDKSSVFSLSSKYVTGPADSAWPMRGRNAQHTGNME